MMGYIVKALIYTPYAQDPDNLESKDFWEKVNLFHKLPHRNQSEYQIEDFLATEEKAVKPSRKMYSDAAGNPIVVELEFDSKPEFFSDLERAGLKIGAGGDVGISIYAISELGITLFLEYYPHDQEKDLAVFNGNVFIPFHRLISINALHNDVIDLVYINRAILQGNVEKKKKIRRNS